MKAEATVSFLQREALPGSGFRPSNSAGGGSHYREFQRAKKESIQVVIDMPRGLAALWELPWVISSTSKLR